MSTEPNPWARRVKVAAPLALAVFLLALSGLFLVDRDQQAVIESTALEKTAPTKPARALVPMSDPSTPDPYQVPEPPKRYGGSFPRWNLEEFPEGWDEQLATAIHDYFERMEYDVSNPESVRDLERLREEFREFLAGLGPESVTTLATILDVEPNFVDRRFLIYALGDLGPRTEEATFALRDFFMSRYENPQSRSELGHVIMAMGRLQNETSFDVLRELAEPRDEPDAPGPRVSNYRDKFLRALGDHPYREEAIGTFVDAMQSDNHPNVRNNAAQALGKVRSPETLGALYSAFGQETRWPVKQTILGSIGKIGNPNSIQFLEENARNARDPKVRLSAAGALRRIDTPYARQLLRGLARSEPDAKIRRHIDDWAHGDEAQSH
jgi:hypothetical protein